MCCDCRRRLGRTYLVGVFGVARVTKDGDGDGSTMIRKADDDERVSVPADGSRLAGMSVPASTCKDASSGGRGEVLVWLRVQGRARRRRSQRRRTKGPKDGAGQRAPRYDWRGDGAREEGLGECDLPLWRGRGEREEGERMVLCGSSSSAQLQLPRNGQQGHGAAGFGPVRRGRGRIGSRGLVDEVVVMRLCFLRYPVASAASVCGGCLRVAAGRRCSLGGCVGWCVPHSARHSEPQ